MKATIISAALALMCISAAGGNHNTFDGSDSRILYEGRTLVKDNCVSFDWSGTRIRIDFNGTMLKMQFSESGTDYFNVWIDSEPAVKYDKVITLKGEGETVLANGLRKGKHSIVLQKRTEAEQGCLTVCGFTTDGSLLQANDPYKRHIEFIGDSYTCGYGTEAINRDQPFRPAEENCNLTYAAIAGRYFDAGIRTICHSGRGIVRNYGDFNPASTMVTKYAQTFDEADDTVKWDAGSDAFCPDIVVIYLGTNDFSTGKQPSLSDWCRGYSSLLEQVRKNYPEVPVLCVSSKADEVMGYYVKEAVEKSGLENIHWTSIQPSAHNSGSDLGASWHPNYNGHRKVASCMIPYISTITGWEMPLKAIE